MFRQAFEHKVAERHDELTRMTWAPRVQVAPARSDQLAIDAHLTAKEVNAVDRQAEGFSLAESCSGCEYTGDPVTRRHRSEEGTDLIDGRRDSLGGYTAG